MSSTDPPPPQPTPWDRVGSFFEDMAAVGATMADRNMKLWMRPPDPGTDGPERWQREWQRWMDAATENTQDIWALWLGGSPRDRVAHLIPTVYLEFHARDDMSGSVSWILTEQVVIPVPSGAIERLPEHARIELSGSDHLGVSALTRSLRARIGSWRTSYVLESFDVRDLRPGAYAGIVYVDEPVARPIANLRIVVRGAPAIAPVPTVLLRWGVPPGTDGAPPSWQPAGPIVLPAPRRPHAPAQIALSGTRADDLAAALTAAPHPTEPAYLLRPLHPDPPSGVEGFYVGSVYVSSPEPRVIANLEVIVHHVPHGASD